MSSASVTAVIVNGSGISSTGIVVTDQVDETHPIVSVTLRVCQGVSADVTRSSILEPLVILPFELVNPHAPLIRYSPQVILTGLATFIPDITILSEL